MSDHLIAITVPKWGLTMEEGKIVAWLVDENEKVTPGDEILEIETTKITNVVEAQDAGTLVRTVVPEGEELPVGALLGVLATAETSADEVDAFVAEFQSTFVPEEKSSGEAGSAHQFADIGSTRVSYLQSGEIKDGPVPVIFIHGYGGEAGGWLFNMDAASEGRPVFAIDLPGHGRSSKKVGTGSIDFFADTLLGFLDYLGVDEAHLVGHSLGAAIACQVATCETSRVKSLTLVAPAGFTDAINDEFLSGFAAVNSRRELKPIMEQLFQDKSLVTRDLLNETLKTLRIDGAREALTAIQQSCFQDGKQNFRFDDLVASGDVPTLVISGESDEVIAPPAGVPHSVVQGTGHMPQIEKSSEVNALIVGHISSA